MEEEDNRVGMAVFYQLVLSLLMMCRNNDNPSPTVYFHFAFISIPVAFTVVASPDVWLGWAAAYCGVSMDPHRRMWARYTLQALFTKWFVDTGEPIYLAWAVYADC